MIYSKISILILILIITTFCKQPTLAVTEFSGSITKSEATVLADKLVNILIGSGKFQLLERSLMGEILKEQGFQQTGCTDQECAVTIGQLLGVEKMCTGTIGKVGSAYSITLRIVSVQTSEIEVTASYDFKGSIEDILYYGMNEVANILLDNIAIAEQKAGLDNNDVLSSRKRNKISPEQKYQKKLKAKKIISITSTVAGGASAAGIVFFKVYQNNLHDKYLAEKNQEKQDEYIASEQRALNASYVAIGATGVFVPTALISWIIKIKKPVSRKFTFLPIITPEYASATCTFSF